MFDAIRKYAVFTGRARRKEYWLFQLLSFLIYFAAGILDSAFGVGAFVAIAFLGLLVPSLAVQFRRLHDIDQSGWWTLLSLIPFGGLVLAVAAIFDGTVGPNRHGDDPKGRTQAVVVDADPVVTPPAAPPEAPAELKANEPRPSSEA